MKEIVIAITNDIDRDRRMLRTADILLDMGYDVEIIGRNFDLQINDDFPITKTYLNCCFSAGILFYTEFNFRLFSRLVLSSYDVILSVDTDTLLACTLASWIRRKPMVIDMHELFTEVPELAKKSFKKSIWKSIENICIPRSTYRYTVSETIAAKLYKRTGFEFDVIRNVPEEKKDDASPNQRPSFTIAYLGVMNIGRGLEQIIDAMVNTEDIELLLIGDGDIHDQLVMQVDRLNLTDRVHFTGWVAPSKVHNHLKSAHLGINLLDPSSESYFLSLANKYFDYIHADLPILTMDFPEYRKLNQIHETSVLLEDLNVSIIQEQITNLKLDTEKYNSLKNNCLKAKQQWHWKEESKQLRTAFKR